MLTAPEYPPQIDRPVSKQPSSFPENYKYSSFLLILCPRNPHFASHTSRNMLYLQPKHPIFPHFPSLSHTDSTTFLSLLLFTAASKRSSLATAWKSLGSELSDARYSPGSCKLGAPCALLVMDALELPYHPVDVAGPKLMGSEGFGRAAGVSLNKVEARQTDAVSVLVSPTIQRCSSLLTHKGIKFQKFQFFFSSKLFQLLLIFILFWKFKDKVFIFVRWWRS